MDDLLPRLLSFPPHPPPPNPPSNEQYHAAIIPHVMMVQKISDKQLLAPTSSGENTLDVIDPSLHTVPYIYILLAQISEAQQKNTKTDPTWLMSKITNFMATFNPIQMRYLGTAFEKLVNQVIMLVRRLGQPYAAVNPIRDALLRLDLAGSMLTSTHLLLVKISLDTRYFAGAVPVISKPILYFPGPRDQPKDKLPCDPSISTPAYITPESGLTLKLRHIDVLEYFLLSGMIFIGLKDWEKALECLENAVTYPTKDGACSKIMVTAYKKWVLVSVLLEGKPINLPKSTSNAPAKLYHTIAKPYETVATLFETATAGRLKSEVEAGQRIWEDDMNSGLMNCVLAAYQKFQIRKLALIYSKISIPEIVNLTMSAETGNRTSSQAVEQLVQTMIQEGSLMATLSQTPGRPSVLTFAASGLILSEAQIKSQLLATTQRIQALSHDIKVTDRLLTHDKDYIKHLVAVKKRAKDGVPAGHEADWNESGIMEEDLMETDKWFQPE